MAAIPLGGASFPYSYQYAVESACLFLPSSGYFNGTTFYNGAWNGNYWSSTRNSATNARNLNFNNNNVNPQNNNNRYTGRTVRGVCQ